MDEQSKPAIRRPKLTIYRLSILVFFENTNFDV